MNEKKTLEFLKHIRDNPQNVRFKEMTRFLKGLTNKLRINGSHHVFNMSNGKHINLQPVPKDKKLCKRYEVEQVVEILEELGFYGKYDKET